MFDELCRPRLLPGEQPLATLVTPDEDGAGGEFELDYAKAGWGHGQMRCVADRDSIITVVDATAERAIRSSCDMVEDVLLVRATVESTCSYSLPDSGAWNFRRPELTVAFLPRGTCFEVGLPAGRAQMAVTLLIRPQALMARCGLRREDLPAPLLQVIDGAARDPAHLFSMPVEPQVQSLVEDVVASRLPARLRAAQLRARVVELAVLMIAAWTERLAAGAETAMRGRDAYLVAAARRILTQRLVDPPTLQELAQELGTNRNKLNQLFQRGLGVTPKAFCVQRRIERAQTLLREGRLNVAQIAETVGYQHQSSFTAAFRDAVGMCPRDYGSRRAAAPEPALAGA